MTLREEIFEAVGGCEKNMTKRSSHNMVMGRNETFFPHHTVSP
jgi:hypothetical protein